MFIYFQHFIRINGDIFRRNYKSAFAFNIYVVDSIGGPPVKSRMGFPNLNVLQRQNFFFYFGHTYG